LGLTFWQKFDQGSQGEEAFCSPKELLFDRLLTIFELVGVVSAIHRRELPN
jgi:hypothetical protein